jgi:hypothetical protein
MTISQSRLFQGEDAGLDGSSKSLARNEASGTATVSEQEPKYGGGTPHGRFFRAGLAVEVSAGAFMKSK